MSTKKSGGSTRLGRDSNPQYLGVKINDNQAVKTGQVIIRQRGTKFRAGENTKLGSDDTVFSLIDGVVKFATKRVTKFDGSKKLVKIVNVVPSK